MTTYSQRTLFGGAIFCEIPTEWRDVSDVRQVPDHQEVWQSREDEVLVVEILERQQVDDVAAANFFFTDLAESNGATRPGDHSFQPAAAPRMTHAEGVVACAGVGFQKVAKGRGTDIDGQPRDNQGINWTFIELCVLRLPRVKTDILVTISKPESNYNVEPPVAMNSVISWSADFQKVLSTIQVRDWGLFE
jgi:hypothetical protein